MQRIAIVGFGFSGNLVLAHLVRYTTPLEIYVIDPQLTALGVAYATPYREHLLNVRAANMSAFPDAPEDFVRWLGTQQLPYGPTDFVPRHIYGDYLTHIFQQSQQLATTHGHSVKLVPSIAVALNRHEDAYALVTERGDAIAVDQVIMATGNEFKSMAAPVKAPMLQKPWAVDALKDAATQAGPIMLLGSGLTAVDVVLALRHEGYRGQIIMRSRNGLLPQAHRDHTHSAVFTAEEIAAQQTLPQWCRWMRRQTHTASNWRNVVDGLRPFTHAAWQRLGTREQLRFFRRLASFWNVHRHRMAPQIAAQIAQEIAQGTVQISGKHTALEVPTLIINCTGPELNVEKSAQPLLKSLLSQGLIEPHATSIGIAVDAQHRAWGGAYPNLYAMGALMTGQLLESTAVPELRVQAKTVAEAVCK